MSFLLKLSWNNMNHIGFNSKIYFPHSRVCIVLVHGRFEIEIAGYTVICRIDHQTTLYRLIALLQHGFSKVCSNRYGVVWVLASYNSKEFLFWPCQTICRIESSYFASSPDRTLLFLLINASNGNWKYAFWNLWSQPVSLVKEIGRASCRERVSSPV